MGDCLGTSDAVGFTQILPVIFHVGCTSSNLNTEVKQDWAVIILGWETLHGISGFAGTVWISFSLVSQPFNKLRGVLSLHKVPSLKQKQTQSAISTQAVVHACRELLLKGKGSVLLESLF
jgi:hypothetical protein